MGSCSDVQKRRGDGRMSSSWLLGPHAVPGLSETLRQCPVLWRHSFLYTRLWSSQSMAITTVEPSTVFYLDFNYALSMQHCGLSVALGFRHTAAVGTLSLFQGTWSSPCPQPRDWGSGIPDMHMVFTSAVEVQSHHPWSSWVSRNRSRPITCSSASSHPCLHLPLFFACTES